MIGLILPALLYGLSFALGVLVGYEVRALTHRRHAAGDTAPVRSLIEWAHVRPRTVGLTLIGIALAANIATGAALIVTRAAVADRDSREAVRIACQGEFNRVVGERLQQRERAAADATDAELDLWRSIAAAAERDDLTGERLQVLIEEYLGELRSLNRERASNPFPPGNYCEDR